MKFAVIGAGVIGRLRAETIAARTDTDLVAVADPDEGAREAGASALGCRCHADYRALLEQESPDAVVVSSPAPLHEEICVAALEAGCHVLCEKPLAATTGACRRILAAAEAAGRRVAVGFNHRFYPSIKFLKACVDEGRIGRIDHLRVFGGHDGLHNFRADWMYKSELSGGGAMMDIGIHMTDLMRYVAGEVSEVYGLTTGRIWNVEGSEDNALAIFKTAAGVPILYQATWTEWRGYHFFVDVYGDLGMVRGYYAPMYNLLVTQPEPGGPRRKQRKLYPEIILREKLKGWQTTTRLTFADELDELVRLIAGEDVALADGHAGLRAAEVAEAVYRSRDEGGPVSLAP